MHRRRTQERLRVLRSPVLQWRTGAIHIHLRLGRPQGRWWFWITKPEPEPEAEYCKSQAPALSCWGESEVNTCTQVQNVQKAPTFESETCGVLWLQRWKVELAIFDLAIAVIAGGRIWPHEAYQCRWWCPQRQRTWNEQKQRSHDNSTDWARYHRSADPEPKAEAAGLGWYTEPCHVRWGVLTEHHDHQLDLKPHDLLQCAQTEWLPVKYILWRGRGRGQWEWEWKWGGRRLP